jgi:hypothetical protein
MIEYKDRKALSIIKNGNSTDYLAPSIVVGCLLDCAYCVLPNTLITTPNGVKKAEEIQEGDQVISFSLDTWKSEIDLVTVIGQRETDELYVIEVGSETVIVTGEHPFYTKDKGWVEARYLTEDDELLCDIHDLNL